MFVSTRFAPFPTYEELSKAFAEEDIRARRLSARELANLIAARGQGRLSIFEDRTAGGETTSKRLAGEKPRRGVPREEFQVRLNGQQNGDAWSSVLRISLLGEATIEQLEPLQALSVSAATELEGAEVKQQEVEQPNELAPPLPKLDESTAPSPEGSIAMIGTSLAMQEVFRRIRLYASKPCAVLISGETGTGKERVAQSLHSLSGRSGSFIPVNCAELLSPELIASELFGHERGAFTGAVTTKRGAFEAAHGGTLFLDEISELPLPQQGALLRALEEGKIRRVGSTQERAVDVRVLAASNANLELLVETGAFRADLFHRLAVLTIWLPPLRDRVEEIAPLARGRLDELEQRCGRRLRLTGEALAALEAHQWPGNVRELLNTVERGWINSVADEIHAADLELQGPRHASPAATSCDELLREFERRMFWTALEAAGGERRRAAKLLGISEQHFHRRLRALAKELKAVPTEFAHVALDASHAELMKEFERNLLLSALEACGWRREQAASRLALAARRLYRRLHALGVYGAKPSSGSFGAEEFAEESTLHLRESLPSAA